MTVRCDFCGRELAEGQGERVAIEVHTHPASMARGLFRSFVRLACSGGCALDTLGAIGVRRPLTENPDDLCARCHYTRAAHEKGGYFKLCDAFVSRPPPGPPAPDLSKLSMDELQAFMDDARARVLGVKAPAPAPDAGGQVPAELRGTLEGSKSPPQGCRRRESNPRLPDASRKRRTPLSPPKGRAAK